MRRECRERVNDADMHHGKCVMHMLVHAKRLFRSKDICIAITDKMNYIFSVRVISPNWKLRGLYIHIKWLIKYYIYNDVQS